jgi:hypothetical protein
VSLHQQALDALDRYSGAMGTGRLVGALRAAVELHAPVPCNYGNCLNAGHRVCKTCGSGINADDCSTVQAIARELGVQEGDRG